MPIRIDYTPVGALGKLATQAGQNQAAQTSFENSLRLRAQQQQGTQGLLSYLLQKKQMEEQARRFDLSRQDQQAQFAASMGARSAAIRQSREQAAQQFSLQQAAGKRADLAQQLAFVREQRLAATAETPEQKLMRSASLADYKKQLEMSYAPQIEAAKTLGDLAGAEMKRIQFAGLVDARADELAAEGWDTEASKVAGKLLKRPGLSTARPEKPSVPQTAAVEQAQREYNIVLKEARDASDALNKLYGSGKDLSKPNAKATLDVLKANADAANSKLTSASEKLRGVEQAAQDARQKELSRYNQPSLPGGGKMAKTPGEKSKPKTMTPEEMDMAQGLAYYSSAITSPEAEKQVKAQESKVATLSPQVIDQQVRSIPVEIVQELARADMAQGRPQPDGRRLLMLYHAMQARIQSDAQKLQPTSQPTTRPTTGIGFVLGG